MMIGGGYKKGMAGVWVWGDRWRSLEKGCIEESAGIFAIFCHEVEMRVALILRDAWTESAWTQRMDSKRIFSVPYPGQAVSQDRT